VLLSTCYWVDKIKEMGRACGTYGEEKYVQCFVGKSEGDSLEDLGVYDRIILKRILRKQDATTWNGLTLLWIGASGRLLRTR